MKMFRRLARIDAVFRIFDMRSGFIAVFVALHSGFVENPVNRFGVFWRETTSMRMNSIGDVTSSVFRGVFSFSFFTFFRELVAHRSILHGSFFVRFDVRSMMFFWRSADLQSVMVRASYISTIRKSIFGLRAIIPFDVRVLRRGSNNFSVFVFARHQRIVTVLTFGWMKRIRS